MDQTRHLGATTERKNGPQTRHLWQALAAATSLSAVLAGCGAPPEVTGDPAPTGNQQTSRSIDRPGHSHAPVRTAGGTVHYYGGPVIPSPKVYAVWWGNPANLNPAITAAHGGIADFFAGITNSNFIDWLNEYDTNINAQAGSHSGQPGTDQFIGRGNYVGAITLSNIPAGNVTDAQIQTAINTGIAAKVLPQPDASTIYALYFPSSVSITLDGSVSCVSFGAYHEVALETGTPNAYYLVVPDCGDSFAGTTVVTSHELVEATTDGEPTPGSNPDYPQAWNDASGNEVGDLCEGTSGSVATALGSFEVQGIWDERSQGCKVTTTAAQDFSVALSPNTATLPTSSNGNFAVQTATTAGAAEALTLTVAAPTGVTASLSQASITSGQPATLTVSAASAQNNVQVVVSAVGAAGTHTAALLLNVTHGGSGGIVNGGFETGDLSGWTPSGASTSVVSSGAHGGKYAARLGNTTATKGDSSIAQTFTVPTGTSKLTFWYKMTCPDTVLYDWATATLKDNTTGKTATVLPKVCATNSWTEVTASVTAGHSVTLKLTSHDDDSSGDPSYTLYDDVAVQ